MKDMESNYLCSIAEGLAHVNIEDLMQAGKVIKQAYESQCNIYVFGNGACSALASHMAGDLGKISALDIGKGPEYKSTKRLKIMSLTDNAAWISALGNDVAFEDIFLEQLKNFLEPHDVVIGLSGSGNSTNVIRALKYATTLGATVISMTGAMESAKTIRSYSDICISAPSKSIDQIEDYHVMFHHILARRLRNEIESEHCSLKLQDPLELA